MKVDSLGPMVGPPSMGYRPVQLGVNIFRGTDATSRRFLYTQHNDQVLSWSRWELTGFGLDGSPLRFELTRDLELPGQRELDPDCGYWSLGSKRPAAVDVDGNGFTSRVLGYGEPGTPPLPERSVGAGGRKLRVSFKSDFDGDLMMLAHVDESDAELWCVLVTDDFGGVSEADVYVSPDGESTGYSNQLAGQARWMVNEARSGMVHVILPNQPGVRIRVK